MSIKEFLKNAPTSDDFSKNLGQITWLMTMSRDHRKCTIVDIERKFFHPLMLKQVRIFKKGKQPVAALAWAYASDELINKLMTGTYEMELRDWRSGPNITIIDCISPFADRDVIEKQFMRQVAQATQN